MLKKIEETFVSGYSSKELIDIYESLARLQIIDNTDDRTKRKWASKPSIYTIFKDITDNGIATFRSSSQTLDIGSAYVVYIYFNSFLSLNTWAQDARNKIQSNIKSFRLDNDGNYIDKFGKPVNLDMYKDIQIDPHQFIDMDFFRKAINGELKVYCSCPAFRWWGYAHIMQRHDSLLAPHGEQYKHPDIRNPKMIGTVCKHLYNALKYLPANVVSMYSLYKNKFLKDIKPLDKNLLK